MSARISQSVVLTPASWRARRIGRALALPTSPDEAIRAVTIVDTTAEVASEAQHASPEPTELALAQTVEAPKTPQLARAAEAYARVQGGLPNIAVGRYLRVQA